MFLKKNHSFDKYSDYYLVGIGGAGMSAIALVLKGMGYSVRGSDMKDSRYTALLRKEGIEVSIGHEGNNIKGADVVIHSTAIPAENPELTSARKEDIPVYSRSDILSWIINMRKGIAIAGTHGKTTTTSMISMMFRELGLDPTIVVGGELNELGSNAINGSSQYVVAEACESDGSFLKYKPFMAIVTNIEEDHFDHYGSMEELRDGFIKFMSNIKKDGWLVINGDETDAVDIPERNDLNILTFGLSENNDIYASGIEYKDLGSKFMLNYGNKTIKVTLSVPGLHNIKNSLAAFAACAALGADLEEAAPILKGFTGVKRRFDSRGQIKGAAVFDDYAHHPSEVKVTLEAASRSKKDGRIIAVFQPHRYSRLAHLNQEFGEAFGDSDILVITDVYGAGEQPVPGINGKMLVDSIIDNDFKNKIAYIPRLADIPNYIDRQLKPGDMLLLMGAGDITRVTDELLKNKKDN
jgi:UDP-N-acetylmuramate--alanine ligase